MGFDNDTSGQIPLIWCKYLKCLTNLFHLPFTTCSFTCIHSVNVKTLLHTLFYSCAYSWMMQDNDMTDKKKKYQIKCYYLTVLTSTHEPTIPYSIILLSLSTNTDYTTCSVSYLSLSSGHPWPGFPFSDKICFRFQKWQPLSGKKKIVMIIGFSLERPLSTLNCFIRFSSSLEFKFLWK